MENLYFPLFLVALAVAVIWLFSRASDRRDRDSRIARTPAGRIVDSDRLARDTERRGPAARGVAASTTPKGKDIWQTRRERAAKESFGASASRRNVYHADYLGPKTESDQGGRSPYALRDQEISKTEHLSLDEYLAKLEREQAEQAAAKEAGLSMTAMKYEPGEPSSAEDEKGRRKQASFKP